MFTAEQRFTSQKPDHTVIGEICFRHGIFLAIYFSETISESRCYRAFKQVCRLTNRVTMSRFRESITGHIGIRSIAERSNRSAYDFRAKRGWRPRRYHLRLSNRSRPLRSQLMASGPCRLARLYSSWRSRRQCEARGSIYGDNDSITDTQHNKRKQLDQQAKYTPQ